MSNGYVFEFKRQQLMDGSWAEMPILLSPERHVLPETHSLMAAAAIIGTALHDTDGSLGELVDEVGGILNGETVSGIIIEDELGAGAVTISPEDSEIEVRDRGISVVPTGMMFDMLYVWHGIDKPDAS